MVLAVLAVLTAPAAADYNIFHLVPEDSSCDPGEDVTVWVKVNTSYNDINGVQASIIFDPSIVNVTNVVEGANPDWYMWDWHIFNLHGYTYVKITSSDPMGAFGPGELDIGKMTLRCEAPGISSLHFANASEVTEEDMTMIVNPTHTNGIWPITTEDGTFTCLAPQETYSKDLVGGWNLISLPLTADDMTVSSVFSSVAGKYDALYSYDATTHSWVALGDDDTLENGVGYFIHMTESGTWTYQGSAYTAMSISLESGLNMVGWLNCSKPIDDALSSIEGNYRYVARWNSTAHKFEVYVPGAPSGFNDFNTMERGEGYFISMKTSDTLTASC